MIPSTSRILESMKYTFEEVLMPNVQGDYEKSQCLTMLNLFRYTAQLAKQEGQMLWDGKRELEVVIAEISRYLASLPASNERDRVAAKLNEPLIDAPDGYPSVDYLNAINLELRDRLEQALAYLTAFPADAKKRDDYRAIREKIRGAIVADIKRVDELMQESFISKRR